MGNVHIRDIDDREDRIYQGQFFKIRGGSKMLFLLIGVGFTDNWDLSGSMVVCMRRSIKSSITARSTFVDRFIPIEARNDSNNCGRIYSTKKDIVETYFNDYDISAEDLKVIDVEILKYG